MKKIFSHVKNIISVAIIGIMFPVFVFAQTANMMIDITVGAQNPSEETINQYQKVFDITPLIAVTPNISTQTYTLKIFQGNAVGGTSIDTPILLSGTLTTSPTVDGLVPGNYVAAVYMGTSKVSPTVPFTINDTNPTGTNGIPNSIGAEQFPPTNVGVFKISFTPGGQTITETTAEINGTLSSIVLSPLTLTAVSGPVGSPLGNEQSLLSISYPGLPPGEQKPIELSFSGLTPGQTYSFAFKNGGSTSQSISFTTPNGTTIMNPVFAGNVLGVNENPGGLDPVVDTVSDKGIVPKCGRTPGEGIPEEETHMCGYEDFIQLISNVIQYAVIIIGPIIGIFVIYSGFMIMWLGKDGDPTAEIMAELKKHKQRLLRIAIGVAVMLSSYLIVMTIIRELGVKPEYTLIDIIS